MKRIFLSIFFSILFIAVFAVFTVRAEEIKTETGLFTGRKMGSQGNGLEMYKNAKEDFLKFKKDCKEPMLTPIEKCNNFQQTALEKAKQALLNQLNAFDRVFGNLLSRFNSKTDERSLKEKEIINSAYDVYKATEEQYKQKIQDAKTMDELRDINKNMRTDMKQALSLIRIAGGRVNVLKAAELLSRVREKAAEVNKLINKIASSGKDVTVATEYYNKSVSDMDFAQAKYDEALNLLKNMTNESAVADSGKAHALVKEGNTLLKDAAKNLKLAVSSLKESSGK